MAETHARRTREIFLVWADGRGSGEDGAYPFRLDLKRLEELQALTDSGPELIKIKLETGTWKAADIRETIRLGLIGAGMDPSNALRLVMLYVDDECLLENKQIAHAVIVAALVVGKKKIDGEAKPAPTEAGDGISPNSTAPEQF